jgi:hypothetical protein
MCVTNTLLRRKAIVLPGLKVGLPLKATDHSTTGLAVVSNPVSLGSTPTYENEYVRPNGLPINSAPWHNWSSPINTVSDSTDADSKDKRPRRRRKPQKPGKTAKQNDRHFVVHNYHDHASDEPIHYDHEEEEAHPGRRGGVSVSFPTKLHQMLDQIEMDGYAHVISWQGHGRAFLVHDPHEFASHIMPKYFKHTKLTSFQRQLNLYGFCRLTKGPDARAYYHELFLRGMPFLCRKMSRVKVKGTGYKAASSPEQEPDFYSMPPVLVTPPDSGASDHDSADSDSDDVSILSVYPYNPNQQQLGSPIVQVWQQPSLMSEPVASFDSTLSFDMPSSSLPTEVHGYATAYNESCYSDFDHGEDHVLEDAIVKMLSENETDDCSSAPSVDDLFEAWGSTMTAADMDLFESLDSDDQLGSLLECFIA